MLVRVVIDVQIPKKFGDASPSNGWIYGAFDCEVFSKKYG